jgi:minichromosome maintenance protein 10
MDELLSLFDDDNTAGGIPVASAGAGTAEATVPKQCQNEDDFASAFFCQSSTSKSKVNTQSNNSKGRPLSAVSKAAVITGNNASKHDQTSCDPITGLRVTDRKTSRAEMCDHFSTLTYKSVSMLAAASRSEWSTTTDGSDKGSTTLATCGIITCDTTSRVSSKTGRAFGMIQLGDIIGGSSLPHKSNNIHPLVTVFLFGDALSVIQRNKRFLQKGWVCAILSPSLMPSKGDNKAGSSSTAVSLSVNDPRQILLIGRSVDAGNCKGTIRKKVASDYGGSKFEDVGCSTLIDLRGGSRYCITHRRQGLSSRGTTSTNNSKTSSDNSRLQKLRLDNVRNGITHASSFNNTNHQRNNNLLSQNSMQVGRTSSISLSEALSRPGFLDETLPVAAPSSMTTTTQHLKNTPKHMKKATNVKETRVLHNPYAKSKATDQCAKRKGHEDVLGEALGRKKARLDNSISKNASSMKANVNKVFQAEGYDGSVKVPKPSSLFRKAATFRPGSLSSSANNKTATSDILEKQRSLAELLQQKKQGVVNSRTEDLLSRLSSNMTRVHPSSSSVKSGQSTRNTFASSFGDFGNDNDILNAKSRFASAANAQEYARARGAIQELEVKEFEMDQRKQKRTSGGGATKNGGKEKEASTKGIVTAGWICKTCKKKTPMKPVVCIRSRHDVHQQRELSNRKSTIGSTKERLQRHGKEAEEGGLTLGSGLEWSWRGGIN